MDLSPSDRDALIRTVIGEAGAEPIDGQAAVASVVLNRLNKGTYGKSVGDVVHAPNAFEAWTKADQLNAIPTNSPQYKAIANVVDGVTSGATPDPTRGAVNFIDPKLQLAEGRAIPDWAQGPGQTIGNQVFYGGSPVANATTDPAISNLNQWRSLPAAQPSSSATAAASGTDPAIDNLSQWRTLSATPAAPAKLPPVQTALGAPLPPSGGKGTGADVPITGVDQGPGAAFDYSGISGIPIAGPLAMAGINNAASSFYSRLTGTPADQLLQQQQANQRTTTAAHPIASGAGGVVGTTAALVPAMATAPEWFTGAGYGLLGRSVIGAGTNAAIGATDAAVRGGNVGQIATEGALGAAGGGALPVLGKAIGWGASKLLGMAAPVASSAGNVVANRLAAGGASAGDVTSAMAANPTLRPIDVNPGLLQTAQRVAAKGSPEARAIIDQSVGSTTSQPPLSPLYAKAYAEPVVVSKEIQQVLDTTEGQKALASAQSLARAELKLPDSAPDPINPADPGTQGFDYIKRAYDAKITKLFAKPGGAQMGRALAQQRDQLVASVDAQNPYYAPARAEAQSQIQAAQATTASNKTLAKASAAGSQAATDQALGLNSNGPSRASKLLGFGADLLGGGVGAVAARWYGVPEPIASYIGAGTAATTQAAQMALSKGVAAFGNARGRVVAQALTDPMAFTQLMGTVARNREVGRVAAKWVGKIPAAATLPASKLLGGQPQPQQSQQ
jgi:N-acetylmuramoyl-L-alanine amidase